MSMYEGLAKCHTKLSRGEVWCRACGHSEKVDSAYCLQYGWPKCCGETMTIDSPQEREAMEGIPTEPESIDVP